MAKFTKDEIVVQFRNTHGNRYDYSLVEYLGDGVKVKIICSVHGIFEQVAGKHKRGNGCRKCALDEIKPRQSQESLIKQFRLVHGMKYDYSQVDFRGVIYKVKIICPIHGLFEQRVTMHKKGQGCAKCMHDEKRHSEEKVVRKFREVHGLRYDYSLVEYINTDTKVKIICKEHGVFEQTSEKHIVGNGCPKCIGRHKTWEEVLVEFNKAHGDRYDYSESEFDRVTRKIKIKCNVHGDFLQTPQNHISGKGCIKCSGTYQFTTVEIVEQFKTVHGDQYDYSLVEYLNTKSRVKIICKEHGVFEQLPGLHKNKTGCPRCANSYSPTSLEVIEQFRAIHSDRYDYSKVDYQGAFKKVIITCREHGDFLQTPKSHKKGSGCPECAVTIGYTKSNYVEYCNQHDGTCYLYLINCFNENENFYKIGISRLGASQRFNGYLKMPYSYSIIGEIKGDVGYIWDVEKSLHKVLFSSKYKPNIDFHGKSECFSLIEESILQCFLNSKMDIEILN